MGTQGKVLVFGAGGQLGQELLYTRPADVHCLGFERGQVDISDLGAVQAAIADETPQAVINAAAYTAVDRAEQEPGLAYQVNRDGPDVLARVCAATGVRLLHVSTDFVFDGRAGSPYEPGDSTLPLGVYGASKLAGERAVLDSGADAIVVRTGWVYSQYGANFVKTMLRLMSERDSLSVVEDQIGTPTWARGLARVCWQLAMDEAAHGIYHWSDAGACSWYDFAVAIRDEAMALGVLSACPGIQPIPASQYPTPASRPAYSVLDKARTRAATDTNGQHWRQALHDMLAELAGDIQPATDR